MMNKLNQAKGSNKPAETKLEAEINDVQPKVIPIAPQSSTKPNKLMYLPVLALIALSFVVGLLAANLNKGQYAQIKDMQETIEKQQQAIESLRADLTGSLQQQNDSQVKLINQVKSSLNDSLIQSDTQIKALSATIDDIKASSGSTSQQLGTFKMTLDGLRLQLDKLNQKVFDLTIKVDDKSSSTIIK